MRSVLLGLAILTVVGWLSYEIITLVNKQPGDTISEVAWVLATRPIVPFLVGFVMGLLGGHFFWQERR